LIRKKDLQFEYHFKKEIDFEETEYITDWKSEEIENYLRNVPFFGTKVSEDEVTNKKGGKGKSDSPSSDLILQFNKIDHNIFSSLQQGIINRLYEKSQDLKLDLTIQIPNPDSLNDSFLISLIKDTTDQLGGFGHEKNNLKKQKKRKKIFSRYFWDWIEKIETLFPQ